MCAVVERPVAREEAVAFFHILEKFCPWQGDEDAELSSANAIFFAEGNGAAKCGGFVGIGAEHEHAVYADAELSEFAYALTDVMQPLFFVEQPQRFRIDGFKAYEE